jgi:hypothetical protein
MGTGDDDESSHNAEDAEEFVDFDALEDGGGEREGEGAYVPLRWPRPPYRFPPLIDPNLFKPLMNPMAGISRQLLPKFDFSGILLTQRAVTRNFLSISTPAIHESLFGGLRQQINTLVSSPAFRELAEWARRQMPGNWHEIPVDVLVKAREVIKTEGIPLAWVPRPEVVTELVEAADRDARYSILAARRREIAEDCIAVLKEVTRDQLQVLVRYTSEAAQDLGDGRLLGAQSAANCLLDTLMYDLTIRGHIFTRGNTGLYRAYKEHIEKLEDEESVRWFRVGCTLLPLMPVLKSFDGSKGAIPEKIPTDFNRHASTHRVDPLQYTETNAVVAVMLMTSLLRETQETGW